VVNKRTPKASMVTVRPITEDDKAWIARVMTRCWGSTKVVTRGRVLNVMRLPGYLAMDMKTRVGLVTYAITGKTCEIVTLNSLRPCRGIGSRLVKEVKNVALASHCTRVRVMTTNDNMRALGFYQKHGFTLVAVHRNAIEKARRLKKEIPLIGQDGIPVRDELELEMHL